MGTLGKNFGESDDIFARFGREKFVFGVKEIESYCIAKVFSDGNYYFLKKLESQLVDVNCNVDCGNK